jgi:hypothetical protein
VIRFKNTFVDDPNPKSIFPSFIGLDTIVMDWLGQQGYERHKDFIIKWENDDDRLWVTFGIEALTDTQIETLVGLKFGEYLL